MFFFCEDNILFLYLNDIEVFEICKKRFYLKDFILVGDIIVFVKIELCFMVCK